MRPPSVFVGTAAVTDSQRSNVMDSQRSALTADSTEEGNDQLADLPSNFFIDNRRPSTATSPSRSPHSPRSPRRKASMASEAFAVDRLRAASILPTAEESFGDKKHPLDAPETAIAARVHGRKPYETPYSPTGNLYMHAGGYSYHFYNEGGRQNAGSAYKPLRGDARLRQLHFLSSAAVTGSGRLRTSRIVEPTSHELRIVDQRRATNILTHGALDNLRHVAFARPRTLDASGRPISSSSARSSSASTRGAAATEGAIKLGVSTAHAALRRGMCVERELSKAMVAAFTDAYGPTWHCCVGLSCHYARGAGVSPESPHIYFKVGQLPFLIFRHRNGAATPLEVEKPLNAVKPETRTSPRDLLRTCLAAQRARALSTTLDSGRMLDAVLLPR